MGASLPGLPKVGEGELRLEDLCYDEKTNSCVTHVTGVLNAGGEATPTVGKREQGRYLRRKGFSLL
jgi:hypothetical protein